MSGYGITGYGVYVPRLRLSRAAIAEAHKWMNPSLAASTKGERAFCSWDEDAVTMAVEAGRDCLPADARGAVQSLTLASTTLPYAELSSAAIVASALRLPGDIAAANLTGTARSGPQALLQGLRGSAPALVIASERPVAQPASMAEIQGGAGAAAFALGGDRVIARLVGAASSSIHFVDRFRASEAASDYAWEERWIRDEGYAKIVPPVVARALEEAGIAIGEIDRLVLPSPIRGMGKAIGKTIGFAEHAESRIEERAGFCGAAHGLLALAEALDEAGPGQRILLVGFGQGADALVLETTEALADYRRGRLADALDAGRSTTNYLRYLSFYDRISLDWGMRGEKAGKAALTEQYRSQAQLDGFVARKCGHCGAVQFPVLAYCVDAACAAPASGMEPLPLVDEPAEIFTVTSDWLSYHPAPPLSVGFVQFGNGARVLMEIVDAPPEAVAEGAKLQMVFRIKERDRVRGFNRYFWKATPLAPEAEAT